MTEKQYTFTDLESHANLVKEMVSLESKMKQELGQQVTLIAYSHKDETQLNTES